MMTNGKITEAAREALRGQWRRVAGLTFVRGALGLLVTAFMLALVLVCITSTNNRIEIGGTVYWFGPALALVLLMGVLGGGVSCGDPVSCLLGGLTGFYVISSTGESWFLNGWVLQLLSCVLFPVGVIAASGLCHGFCAVLWDLSQGKAIEWRRLFGWFKRGDYGRSFKVYWLKIGLTMLWLFPASFLWWWAESNMFWGLPAVLILAALVGAWKSYDYVLMPWIVQDNAGLSAWQTARLSQRRMRGVRLQFIRLQCRLLCWLVVPFAGLCVWVVEGHWPSADSPWGLGSIFVLVMSALFWLPYYHVSMAKFYEALERSNK